MKMFKAKYSGEEVVGYEIADIGKAVSSSGMFWIYPMSTYSDVEYIEGHKEKATSLLDVIGDKPKTINIEF